MSRLSPLPRRALGEDAERLFDSIVGGPRASATKGRRLVLEDGSLNGPFNAWLHAPAIGARWSALGETLRFSSRLGHRRFELAVILVAAHTRAAYEWAAHAQLAREAGVPGAVVDAIGAGEAPECAPDDAVIVAFVHHLCRTSQVDQEAYDNAMALLGEAGVVELCSVVGYYLALALSLNTFEVAAPEGADVPWRVV